MSGACFLPETRSRVLASLLMRPRDHLRAPYVAARGHHWFGASDGACVELILRCPRPIGRAWRAKQNPGVVRDQNISAAF